MKNHSVIRATASDRIRNAFDRFLCASPVIGDAIRLTRLLYEMVCEDRTAIRELNDEVKNLRYECQENVKQLEYARQDYNREATAVREMVDKLRQQLRRQGATSDGRARPGTFEQIIEKLDELLRRQSTLRGRLNEMTGHVEIDETNQPTN